MKEIHTLGNGTSTALKYWSVLGLQLCMVQWLVLAKLLFYFAT